MRKYVGVCVGLCAAYLVQDGAMNDAPAPERGHFPTPHCCQHTLLTPLSIFLIEVEIDISLFLSLYINTILLIIEMRM